MKKPDITPTPWRAEKFDSNGNMRLRTEKNDFQIGNIYDKEFGNDNANDNAQAIVTSVNSTYGKNINPEQIEALIESLAEHQLMVQRLLARCIQRHGLDLQDSEDQKTYIRGEQALKNIYFED